MTKELKKIINYVRYIYPTTDIVLLNQILYYSDYLSLEANGVPITWSKYHILNNVPYCAAILAEWYPIDFTIAVKEIPTVQQYVATTVTKAIKDLEDIKHSFSDDGINIFIQRVCNIFGRPTIDPEGMLFYITQEWDKRDRKSILKKYRESLQAKKYHCRGEEGRLMECDKYKAE